jgi:hypothetical protein
MEKLLGAVIIAIAIVLQMDLSMPIINAHVMLKLLRCAMYIAVAAAMLMENGLTR